MAYYSGGAMDDRLLLDKAHLPVGFLFDGSIHGEHGIFPALTIGVASSHDGDNARWS